MNSIDYGNRLKELAIRKVFGSSNSQIRNQFITETVIVTILSGAFSVVFFDIFRYYFEGLAHSTIANIFILLLILWLLVNLMNFLFSIQPSRTGFEKILKINRRLSSMLPVKSLVFIELVLALTFLLIIVELSNETHLNNSLTFSYPSLNISINAVWMTSSLLIMNAIWGLYLLSQQELKYLADQVFEKRDEGASSIKIIGFFIKKNLLLTAGAILSSWLIILWINLNWLAEYSYTFIDWKTIIPAGFFSVLILILISGYHVLNALNKNSA